MWVCLPRVQLAPAKSQPISNPWGVVLGLVGKGGENSGPKVSHGAQIKGLRAGTLVWKNKRLALGLKTQGHRGPGRDFK